MRRLRKAGLTIYLGIGLLMVSGAVILAQAGPCGVTIWNTFFCQPGGGIPKPPPQQPPSQPPPGGGSQPPAPSGPTRPAPTPRPTADPWSSGYLVMHCLPVYEGAPGGGDTQVGYIWVIYQLVNGVWMQSIGGFEPPGACTGDSSQPPSPPKPLPCPPGWSDDGVWCSWERYVEARIPPLPVTYTPYPRGIVVDRMRFMVGALITQPWNCSAPVNEWSPYPWGYHPDYRNLVLCLRWRQVRYPEPGSDPAPGWIRWVWDERAWGTPKDFVSRAAMTEHVYVTSSAQKTENGPGSLPAYQVEAHSFWVVDWQMSWERRVRWYTCEAGDKDDTCDGEARRREQWHERWDPGSDAGTADLRTYGRPHFYADSTKIIVPDGRTMHVLPVPVIEVQGVIGTPP